jgi:hypothetical protein
MESNIIERLFASFSELEASISKARDTFKSRPTVPDSVLKRLESYDTILAKQRALAVSLCEAISRKNWDEVNRNVGLINGLSAMIRDDAKAILAAVAVAEDHEQINLDESENFC